MTEMYMCRTAYDFELGNTSVALYSTVADLREARPCIDECGIVAVTVTLARVVEPGIPYSERGGE
jgi:hypothetical protein